MYNGEPILVKIDPIYYTVMEMCVNMFIMTEGS